MKLRKIKTVDKEFDPILKKQDFSTSASKTSENVFLFVFISWLVSFGVRIRKQYFNDVVRNKLQIINVYKSKSKEDQKFKKSMCHVNMLQILTYEKRFPKTISQ